jgi:TRAP transporter TAXI family solute receptor
MKILKNIYCPLCILSFILLISYIVLDSNKHSKVINIAVGKPLGAYATYTEAYKKELKKYDVTLKITYTDGSMEAQAKLMSNKVDFAFIQSGTQQQNQHEEPLVLANVAYEPIWIFHKDKTITSLEELKNKAVNLGNKNSGTYPIASQLMSLINQNSKASFHNAKDAFNQLKNGQIDAMFYVIGVKSSRLQSILHTPNISILNFENAQSYRKFFIQKEDYYEIITIEKNAIDIVKKIPKTTKTLLAKTTMLVTKNASTEMSRLFLKVAQKVHSKMGFIKSEHTFPNVKNLKLPQSKASVEYFQEPEHRYERVWYMKEHFWLAQTFKKLEDMVMSVIVLLGLIAFFIEVIYPISKIFTRRKINRWYRKVNKIDTQMDTLSLDELKERRAILEDTLTEMQDNDNIDPIHLEAYYSVQHQITNIIEEFERRIKEKQAKEILV